MKPMSSTWMLAVFAGGLLIAAGCSSTDKPKPTPLEEVASPIAGRQVWNRAVGTLDFPLQITARGDSFVVAGGDGSVFALDAQSGREVWRGSADRPLSAGVGSDGRYAAVITRDNELVVFDKGVKRWNLALGSRTTAAPLVAGERVFVLGVDRAVQAFDAQDGTALWTFRRPGDALTLAQPGVIGAFKDTLLVGQGSALVGVDPIRGTIRWEVPLASARGTNEVERLADLVGPAVRVDSTVCARAFQRAVACADADNGRLHWSRSSSGVKPVAADAERVYGADASDRITAWNTADGAVAWTNERLLYRGLSAPLSVGNTVVFGDAEGFVHFLARDTGKTRLRLPTDGSAVVGQPQRIGTTVLVATRSGGLFAFRPE
jgi:outer membrane assembly lipoprotein YfgL